jgi:hypothetical protein
MTRSVKEELKVFWLKIQMRVITLTITSRMELRDLKGMRRKFPNGFFKVNIIKKG